MLFVRPILTSRWRRGRKFATTLRIPPIPLGRMLAARLMRPEPVIHRFSSERGNCTFVARLVERPGTKAQATVEGKIKRASPPPELRS